MAAALVPQIRAVQVSHQAQGGISEVPCGPTSQGLLGCRCHRESSSAFAQSGRRRSQGTAVSACCTVLITCMSLRCRALAPASTS